MPLKLSAFTFGPQGPAASVHDRSVRVSARPEDGTPQHVDPTRKLRVTFDMVLDQPIYNQGRLDQVFFVLDNPVISEAPPPEQLAAPIPASAPAQDIPPPAPTTPEAPTPQTPETTEPAAAA